MATGKQWDAITAGTVLGGMPEIRSIAEKSAQTAKRGAPAQISSGHIVEAASSAPCTSLYGFFEQDAQNLTADGAKKARILKADSNRRFVGSLDTAALTQAMIGSNVALVISSNTWVLSTSTAVSSVARFHIHGPAEGFALGDAYPLVEFTVDDDAIQYTT